ncbi:trypsin-like peptidase domain-containing protein, partial [Paracoccaceae bacterium]|nr:trypsin-like peptidase domain-containing protein [Paracoccaceae bacterium]
MKNLSLTFCLVIAALFASVGSGFASDLPPCPEYRHPTKSPWINCFGSFTYPKGGKYVGEFKDDKINGQGTHTWADGEKYVGEFKDNDQHGQGTYTWANGEKYVGEFLNDKKNGQGTVKWANGDKYVGEYKDGKRNGQGVLTYVDGTVEEGIWKDGEFQYAKKLSPPVPVAKTPTQDDEIISASSGSGFAVSSDGYVITNHHVIEGCQKVVVHTKGKELPVRVITYDPQNDLALLKGDFRPKTVFPLSNNRPELLQDIYVAGFPFGDKFSTSVKVTKGIISSLTGLGNNFSNI